MYSKTEPNYNNNDDFIDLFEERLSSYTGAPYAVVVDRCTNAILLSLQYLFAKSQPITIPAHTYLSVPMTLINYGYNIKFEYEEWTSHYQLGSTNVYDYAVGFKKDMYVPGQIQCLSFQQKKRLAIGKGGAILLDDEVMYQQLKRMRHDGRISRMSTKQEMETAPENIIIGYHMYMSPDEAAKGTLLLNQLSESYQDGSYLDYPNISTLPCFKDYI